MKHYTKEELELFRNGHMSVFGRISCAAHLDECKDCRDTFEELKKEDLFLDELRSSVQIYQAKE